MTHAIRIATAADAEQIAAVHREAFAGDDEASIVAALARAGAITESLVAVDERGLVIGHVAFSPVAIDGPSERGRAQGLAPLGVRTAWQRRGVGGDLVRTGLERLRARGGGAVVVLGHPDYYARFGFVDARQLGLAWEVPGHEASFMAMVLTPGRGPAPPGVVRYRPEVMGFALRPARHDELDAIQALELRAAARFATSAHPHAADLPPLARTILDTAIAADRLWVVALRSGELVGFVAWEARDRDRYVLEVDVDPRHAGARLGAALLDQAALVAMRDGGERLLLRTFIDVPWNAPYYQRLGFAPVTPPAWLDETIAREVAAGLDPARRVTMARALTDAGVAASGA